MLLTEFLHRLETLLPASTAMQGDRLGLQVQSGRSTVRRVLCCLDCTEEVVNEALTRGVDTIVCFHPLIFSPQTRIVDDNRIGHCIQTLIRNSICLISAHTNFDAHPQGTNEALARALGLEIESLLVPDALVSGHGMGVVCNAMGLSYQELLGRVRHVCTSPIRHSAVCPTPLQRVALVAGSGFSFFSQALLSGSQVFITADLKYHNFFQTEGRIALIDPGHYEMERFVPSALVELFQNACSDDADMTFMTTQLNTNPVRYYNGNE